ncbi:MAG: DegT/DnrJ/EryC1/StrS family aminotransferase [Holophagales bacterium]|nr:DegT/DnrJ/EryC1/StrS family aminotransferase [Holophagales bacterium]
MPLIDFRRQWQEIREDATRVFEEVGASGWYILGREVSSFEEKLAGSWGLGHATGVGNGLDAIEIALRALDIRPGERVLTTPLSAFATTLAIVRCDAVPVFVDTDRHGLLDLAACAEALDRDPFIRFVVPVHLYGHALDMPRLRALAERDGVKVVEDCAQAIGATWDGIPAGTVGAAAAVSFYPTKNLGALGDGGAVLTRSATVDARARRLRHYGQSATYVHDEVGLNSRLDELQAALLGRVLLPRLPVWTERRRAVASRYVLELSNLAVEVPVPPRAEGSVWHLFPVLVAGERRAAFRRHLGERGVESGVHYPTLIPSQGALQPLGHGAPASAFPNASRFAEGEVSLPVHPFLSDDEVARVVGAVNSWSG